MRISAGVVSVAALLLGFSGPLLAAERCLLLHAAGGIWASLGWEDGSTGVPNWETGAIDFSMDPSTGKTSVSNLLFDFSGTMASGSGGYNVDSESRSIRLTNAPVYPASVSLTRPAGCTIGVTPVADAHVHFVNNGYPVSTNTSIAVPSDGRQTYSLRFAAAGSYADKTGAVSCSVVGSLCYSY